MTIRNQIAAAEKSRPSAGDETAMRLLVELIGRRDARFWPWRDYRTAVAVVQARRRYLDGTEGIAARATGQRDWRPTHELRERLASDGLVTLQMANGQVSSMVVTELGDATARAVIGDMPGPAESLLVFARLLTAEGHREFCGRRWLSESVLFNQSCLGNPQDWAGMVGLMLPLLVRGIVDSRCDTLGRISFTTESTMVDSMPESVEVDAEEHPAAWNDWYIPSFNAERDHLRTAEPADGSEIVIPIPATL